MPTPGPLPTSPPATSPPLHLSEIAASHTLSATDRLDSITSEPGPFVSVFLQTHPLLRDNESDLHRRWEELRRSLESDGAPTAALRAIDARIALPRPDDAAAIGIIASADGRTVVDHAQEPPAIDHGVVDTLPYCAPFLEWEQRRVPHLVVVAGDDGADVVSFGVDHHTSITTVAGSGEPMLDALVEHANAIGAELTVVGGEPVAAQRIADELVPLLSPRCRVIVELADSPDEMAEAVVRHVSDASATTTVGYLRELRFLATHDAAVDGLEATVAALRDRSPGVLLIHDDPDDDRRIWVGPDPTDLSFERRHGQDRSARLVDACIVAALAADIPVHVIPTTGRNGPRDDAALIRRPTYAEVTARP